MTENENDKAPIETETTGEHTDESTGDQVIDVEPVAHAEDGRRFYRLDTGPPEALVIHCADPRFQNAFREFITNELGIRHYAPIVIGGGVHSFGAQSFLPKNFKILWEQIKFFVKDTDVRQIIIINHEDCKWYDKMKGFHPRIELPHKGKLDLGEAARVILHDFAGVHVRQFWAGLEGDKVYFTELTSTE
jgi:hypothetical protein